MASKKQKARNAVHAAVAAGKLKNPGKCSLCPSTIEVEAHHPDYDKPLAIVWLCVQCHTKIHQEQGDRPVRDKKADWKRRRPQPFSIRVLEDSLEAYKDAADQAGMSTAEWARHVLDIASGAAKIRHVYYVDVANLEPEEALKKAKDTTHKVRTGKW